MLKSLALSGLHILCPGAGGSCLSILVTCDAHLHCTGCSLGTRESLGVEEGVNFKCSGLSQQLSVGAPASTYSFRISFPLLVRKQKELRKEDLNLCGGEKQESSRQASELGLSILGPRAPVWTLGLRTPWKGNTKVCEYGAWFCFFLLPGKRFHKCTKISKEFLIQEG